MDISTLTTKYQATIPAEIRKFLGLHSGDKLAFRILNGKVIVDKAKPIDLAFMKGLERSLGEWHSEEDDDAFKGL